MNRTFVDADTGEIFKASGDERAKGNKDFVMMFRQFMSEIADLGMADPQALRVLLFICRHMDTKNSLAVTMELMSDMLKLSRQTISAKVKYLKERGWITIYKLGRQNVYMVNPDVFWTAYADQKAYAKFETTVMLSYEDNWQLNKDEKATVRHIDKDVLQKVAEQMELDNQDGQEATA